MADWLSKYVASILFCHMAVIFQNNYAEQWSTVEYIKNQGYPIETHQIETEDGYILTTYRIPHGKNSHIINENVIVLVHGMAGIADNFISLGPDDALAFLLADRGFDVWLFNARGTSHCRRHKTMRPNYFQGRNRFWKFSWHEIAVYDVPANIDYILEKTNKSDLFYVGHSQGGTSYLVMTSEKPEYNMKIRAAVLLAPAAFLQHTEHTVTKIICRFYPLLDRLSKMFNYYELLIPNSPMLNVFLKQFCIASDDLNEACRDVLSLFGGTESGLMNISLIQNVVEYIPTGFSTRQLFHYFQIIRSGHFRQYDHGESVNLQKYNDINPPEYNLNNSVAPVAIFMTNGDTLVSMKSLLELVKVLPNVVMTYEVPYDNFNHIDYIVAYNAKELIYEPMYAFLMKFMKNE